MISFKLFLEKALGLVETITFKDLGPVLAKVDSGNGAFNVLHGIDVKSNGKSIQFKTVNNKVLTKELVDTIKINIGSSNVEQRPVVLFDIAIGGKHYKNVKFSLADRTANEEKVLLGKDFIEQLGGLIDVTKTHNISSNAPQKQ